MQVHKDEEGNISITELKQMEAGLLVTAALRLCEDTDNKEHEVILRGIGIKVDELLDD